MVYNLEKRPLNRHGRRADAAWARGEESRAKAQKLSDQKDKEKYERAESHRKRQAKQHARAVARNGKTL